MPKVILFKGGVETLTFFSQEIANILEEEGFQVFWYDLENAEQSTKKVKKFIRPHETILLSFNFLGLSGEEGIYEEERGYLWEQYDVVCFNIVVDHPLYYTERYEQLPKRYIQVCIDRIHLQYMKTYYEEISCTPFMPLAGTCASKRDPIPYHDRPMDVMFAGNYNDPSQYDSYITRINDEYTAFYKAIINELMLHPEKSLDDVARRHSMLHMGQLTKAEWRILYQHLNFIDLYVRFLARQQVVTALVEGGVTVHVFGHGWEDLKILHPEHLIIHGPVDSKTCLLQMQEAKIALNVMPWFKDGAHDRVFNAALNHCVCLSDSSRYLREELSEKEIAYYSLLDLKGMVRKCQELLENDEKLTIMSENAYQKCEKKHTWKQRALWLMPYMKEQLNKQ